MGQKSGIEWTDSTWNPWYGCDKVSAGCKYCYAERDMARYGKNFKQVKRAANQTFFAPLRQQSFGPKVFVCSWSDFFHPDADVYRDEAMDIINQCETDRPELIFQILTKRPERIQPYMDDIDLQTWPDNVWLGVSVENQFQLEMRGRHLRDISCKMRWLSCEPLLGPINLGQFIHHVDWVVTGGESGSTPRPAKTEWFESLRDQCWGAEIPFFHKQNGGSSRINGHWGGNDINGETYQQFPAHETGQLAN